MKTYLSLDYWKKLLLTFYRAFLSFSEDKCLKLSASLAYYSIFSIGPLLIIIIWLLSFFYGKYYDDFSAKQNVLDRITETFGAQSTDQLQTILDNMLITANSNIGILIGLGTLIFASTKVFIDIQDSINIIWRIKPKPKKGWIKYILNRLISFSMVLGLGFLLIASLLINSIILVLVNFFNEIIPGISNQMLNNLKIALTFIIITSTFGFIFKFLPDAKVRIKTVIYGAVLTSLLFMLGRFGLSIYLQNNATASAFGAAGSIIILMLWVYYSAAILYYGAEFIKEYSNTFEDGIHPNNIAVLVKNTEIEIDGTEQLPKSHLIHSENAVNI